MPGVFNGAGLLYKSTKLTKLRGIGAGSGYLIFELQLHCTHVEIMKLALICIYVFTHQQMLLVNKE